MQILKDNAKILSKTKLNNDVYDIVVLSPEIAKMSKPGQFIQIKSEGFCLRRPISICDIDTKKGTIRLVLQIKGEGTKKISITDDYLDILGPLGNGFNVSDTSKRSAFIGGGIGIFPLLYGAKQFSNNPLILLGFQTKNAVLLEDDFKAYSNNLTIYTDDGTYGEKGYITSTLAKKIIAEKIEVVYACGPMPMLKAVAEICNSLDIFCEISMEERMGCGIGACLVCVCKTKDNNGWDYSHVCKDGPIFNARTVMFDE